VDRPLYVRRTSRKDTDPKKSLALFQPIKAPDAPALLKMNTAKTADSNSAVFVIRLSNAPLNILTKETRVRLLADLHAAAQDVQVQCILLVGSEVAFSVGADINEMDKRIGQSQSSKREAVGRYVAAYKEHNLASVVYALDSCRKPVVALITGQCFGGGLELALGCHYRICTPDAKMRFPEALIGIIPGALGTQLLPRLASFDLCVRMCTGACEMLSAKQAHEAGIVDQVMQVEEEVGMVPKARFESFIARTVRVLRAQIERFRTAAQLKRYAPHPYRRTSLLPVVTHNLSDSSRAAYFAMSRLPSPESGGRASRGALNALLACVQHQRNFIAGARVESDISRRLVVSDQAQALRWAFFAEKAATAPQQAVAGRGRTSSSSSSAGGGDNMVSPSVSSDANVNMMNIRTRISVGVVGSGLMGSGIAASALLSGVPVILCDLSWEALQRAKAGIEQILQSALLKKKLTAAEADELLPLLKISQDMASLAQVDFVIEAVFEDYEVKKEVFRKLDSVCNKECILCSNTSSLDVDLLARETSRPDRVLGLHFFSPAHVMKLVEVVACAGTSEDSLNKVMVLVKKMKKTGVLVTNLPGFVGNRMIFVYAMEAMLLLEDGAKVEQVDAVMRHFGMAMGPFQMADLSGLDVGYKIRLAKGLTAPPKAKKIDGGAGIDTNANPAATDVPPPATGAALSYSAIGDQLYLLGRLGTKNGRGFYQYPALASGGRPVAQPDPKVAEVVNRESQRKAVLQAALIPRPVSGIYHLSPAVSATVSVSDAEVRERLLYSLVNEGFRLLGEHGCVSDRPGDIDVVYTHGYGFPAWRGGPMFWADYAIGLRDLAQSLQKLHQRFPASAWFAPAPLLLRMLHNNVSLLQLQKNPLLVKQLMVQADRPRSKL